MVLIVTLISLMPMHGWICHNGRRISYEIFAFIPLCAATNMILLTADEFSTIFVALEIQSFFFYIGVALRDKSSQLNAAAIVILYRARSSALILTGCLDLQ